MKIVVPDNWGEVTINQLREILMLDTENKTSYAINVASILSNESEKDIRDLPTNKLREIADTVSFVATLPKVKYKNEIEVDGNLYAVPDFKKFSLGQWVDIEELAKDYKLNLHKILAVIYLPAKRKGKKLVIDKYDGELEDRARVLDQMTVQDVYGASVFFSSFAEKLSEGISMRVMEQEIQRLRKNLRKRKRMQTLGKLMRLFTNLPTRIFSKWRK